MRIGVITIFPELFTTFLDTSLVGRAVTKGLLDVQVHDLRSFTDDRHRSVDDEPYGGGGGMVMTAPPWIRAVEELSGSRKPRRILLSPQGPALTDAKVRALAEEEELLLLCGRYEAIDERAIELVVDEEISIGDYVLSGGELPAMVLVEALSRQIPGVVGLPESVEQDSFRSGLLDHCHFTRPPEVNGLKVPTVLLSGNHAAIESWRGVQAVRATVEKRPDLLPKLRPEQLSAVQWRELENLGRSTEVGGQEASPSSVVATQTRDTE
ncbi:MAG: tRNA (guanosine(37)-N1)-methyltransferase TrmD [Deltaproteobacteria bacterium]|nr:tRNA (guanosine(37)-N1)-methyltransferase TrmD [Deltaproteobacteria bacterium]